MKDSANYVARFEKSREVGPYLGLVPRQDGSGDSSPPLGITKTGDQRLRRRLGGSAHSILGPFGKDCDLRRFGLKLAARAEERQEKGGGCRSPKTGRTSPQPLGNGRSVRTAPK